MSRTKQVSLNAEVRSNVRGAGIRVRETTRGLMPFLTLTRPEFDILNAALVAAQQDKRRTREWPIPLEVVNTIQATLSGRTSRPNPAISIEFDEDQQYVMLKFAVTFELVFERRVNTAEISELFDSRRCRMEFGATGDFGALLGEPGFLDAFHELVRGKDSKFRPFLEGQPSKTERPVPRETNRPIKGNGLTASLGAIAGVTVADVAPAKPAKRPRHELNDIASKNGVTRDDVLAVMAAHNPVYTLNATRGDTVPDAWLSEIVAGIEAIKASRAPAAPVAAPAEIPAAPATAPVVKKGRTITVAALAEKIGVSASNVKGAMAIEGIEGDVLTTDEAKKVEAYLTA